MKNSMFSFDPKKMAKAVLGGCILMSTIYVPQQADAQTGNVAARLDSVVADDQITVFQYDSLNRDTLMYINTIHSSGKPVPHSKVTKKRNAAGQVVEQVHYADWDPITGQYTNIDKYTMSYDAQGNMEVKHHYNGATMSSLISMGRTEHQYDAAGKVVEVASYDGNNNPTDQLTYTYDFNGNQTVHNVKLWGVNGTSHDSRRFEYAYNNAGQQVQAEIYQASRSTGLIAVESWEYTYDAYGRPEAERRYSANSGQETHFSEWTFNAADQLTNSRMYRDVNGWIGLDSNSFAYTASGDISVHHNMEQTSPGQWTTNALTERYFNENVDSLIFSEPTAIATPEYSIVQQQTQRIEATFQTYLPYNRQVDSVKTTSPGTGTQTHRYHWTHISLETTTGLDMIATEKKDVTVYPTVFSGQIKVKGVQLDESFDIRLVGMQGTVFEPENVTGNTITVSDRLPTGMYVYHITKGTEVYTGKLIKR